MSLSDIKQEVMEEIGYYVFSGFYSDEYIWDAMIESVENEGECYDEDEDKETLLSWILELKALYPKGGQKNYLCLDSAFKWLNDKNIIALHNAGEIMDEGFDNANEKAAEKVSRGKEIVGCCFYCENDIESMYINENNTLYLAFGNYYDSPNAVEVGKIICAALSEVGLHVEWNQTAEKKIAVTNFVWDKIYTEKMMSGK